MPLYAIRRESDGAIHIGFSKRADNHRLKDYEKAHKRLGLIDKFTALKNWDGTWEDEQNIHDNLLRTERVKGTREWYHPTPKVIGFLFPCEECRKEGVYNQLGIGEHWIVHHRIVRPRPGNVFMSATQTWDNELIITFPLDRFDVIGRLKQIPGIKPDDLEEFGFWWVIPICPETESFIQSFPQFKVHGYARNLLAEPKADRERQEWVKMD